jgi:hypothetical protein
MMSAPVGLETRLAERIVGTAMCLLNPRPGNKILCTKSALKDAILMAVNEAYEIGLLTGRKEEYGELMQPGSPGSGRLDGYPTR